MNILDVKFSNLTFDETVSNILERYQENKKVFIVTANPEIVMHAKRDREYYDIIQKSDFTVADGIGIVIASKILGKPIKERVAGYDLTLALLEEANDKQLSVFFLGAKEETLRKTLENIQIMYPELKIAGFNDGYFDINDKAIIKKVGITNPDIVLVATGLPRQEMWIEKYHETYNKSIAMGVGGSFDVIAGEVKRAPDWIINLNLEWAYRLYKEPQRFIRMLDLPKFMLLVIRKSIFHKGS